MSLRGKVFRGTLTLGGGQSLAYACSFLRNVIVARILTPGDFGIAATFSITISILEIITYISLDRMMVQSKQGDDPVLQATAQSILAIRGFFNAALIFLLAWPISGLFDIPDARWAFHWLAVIPLFRGFTHLDMNRMEREVRFGPMVIVNLIPQVITAAAAWPMAAWLQDYSALLWLLVAKGVLSLAGSHLVARRPYRWAWDRKMVIDMVRFGWPLLINGLLLFGMFEGDRLVVGSFFTMEALGIYAVAAGLAMTLCDLCTRVASSMLLPLLSEVQDEPAAFRKRYALAMQSLAFLAAPFAATFILAGGILVVWIYGSQYTAAAGLIGWLGAGQALRLQRAGLDMAAMARGDTPTLLYASAARSAGLGLAILSTALGADLVWIAAFTVVGEAMAYLTATARLFRIHAISWSLNLKPFLFTIAALAVSGFAAQLIPFDRQVLSLAALLLFVLLSGAAGLLLLPILRDELFTGFLAIRSHADFLWLRRRPSEGHAGERPTSRP